MPAPFFNRRSMNILASNFKQAEFCRNLWLITPEQDTTPEDLGRPEAWVHVSKSLKAGDRIEAVAADGTWFAEFLVRSVAGVQVKVSMLRVLRFDDTKAPVKEENDFDVKFAGAAKWRAIRKSDGAIMVEGLASRDEVKVWLAKNAQAALV